MVGYSVGKKTLLRRTSGIGSIEPVIRTAAVLVSAPPQAFVAVKVYLTVSFTGPSDICVGIMGTDLLPRVSTEPNGASEAASALELDQLSVAPPDSMVLSPIFR